MQSFFKASLLSNPRLHTQQSFFFALFHSNQSLSDASNNTELSKLQLFCKRNVMRICLSSNAYFTNFPVIIYILISLFGEGSVIWRTIALPVSLIDGNKAFLLAFFKVYHLKRGITL